jgi:CMP-N-acetylneuraminic acid synthetase
VWLDDYHWQTDDLPSWAKYPAMSFPATRQELGPVYKRDGTCYAFYRKTLDQGDIYGHDVRPLIIPADESCELDTEADWAAVERRWHERGR